MIILKHYHAENEIGTCFVVAAQIILGYYDTFYNDNIVYPQYDIIVSESKKDVASFTQSPASLVVWEMDIGDIL